MRLFDFATRSLLTAALLGQLWQPAAFAQGVAPATAAVVAETPALVYARRDVVRANQAAEQAAQTAAAAAQALTTAQQSAVTAEASKATAEKALADAVAALTVAETAMKAAETALQERNAALQKTNDDAQADQAAKDLAKTEAEKAASGLVEAGKLREQRTAEKTAAEQARTGALKALEEATSAIKPATEAKAAADKVVVALAPTVAAATQRVAQFEATPPVPDAAAARVIKTFEFKRPAMACVIDPAGERVFAALQDRPIQRLDALLGLRTEIPGHTTWVSALAVHPTAALLVSAGFTGKLHYWDLSTPAPQALRVTDGHKGQVRVAAFSRDGKYLVTGGNDKIVRVWLAADGSLIRELTGHANHVYNLAFHPDGRQLATGDLMGVIKHWDFETGQHVRDLDGSPLHKFDATFRAECGGIRGIDFSPDGRLLAVGGLGELSNAFAGIGKPTVLMFDWTTGQKLHTMTPKGAFQGSLFSLKFHPSGQFLVGCGGSGGGALWFWKPDEPQAFLDVALPNPAYDLCFHPDGLRFALALYNNSVAIYDLAPKPPEAK